MSKALTEIFQFRRAIVARPHVYAKIFIVKNYSSFKEAWDNFVLQETKSQVIFIYISCLKFC